MTEANDSAPLRRMVRCPDGHIFDAATQNACPVCGASAPVANEAAKPLRKNHNGGDFSSQPSRRMFFIFGGAAALALALIIAIMLRGEPAPRESNGSPDKVVVNSGHQETPHDAEPAKNTDRRKAANDIAGYWEINVPTPQGGSVRWTVDFGSDGRYVFTDTSNGASHSGTYQAANGEWSLNGTWTRNPFLAPGTVYADGGTYRLPAPNSLELQGRAGTGFWSRAP